MTGNRISSLKIIRIWSGSALLASLLATLAVHLLPPATASEPTPEPAWKRKLSPHLQADFPYTKACIGSQLITNTTPVMNEGRPALDKQGRPIVNRKITSTDTANKGIAIILGNDAFACFDTDLLRMSAGWTDGYLTSKGVTFDGAHGGFPEIAGWQKFATPRLPGWAGADGKFADTRKEPFGPIPQSLGRWDGVYVVGNSVVLSYTIRGTKIHEQPSSVAKDGLTGFVRTFQIARTTEALSMLVCEVKDAKGSTDGTIATLAGADEQVTKAGLIGAPSGAKLAILDGSRIVMSLPKGMPASTFSLVIWHGSRADEAKFAGLLEDKPQMADYFKGGPSRWPQTVTTKGVLAANQSPDGAYVVDQLTPPTDNPWKRRVRFGGMDFFSDGKRAALSTWDGDVWIVSGIDEKLENLTWKRFASGGFETLGLKIVNDVIYTIGRDEITRYHDLNGDGEADYYENFNNGITSSPGFHEFVFDLHTDAQGNFYTAKAGPVRGGGRGFGGGGGNGEVTAHAGTILKISPDGKKLKVYATGFRAPNGIGVSPGGQVTTGDNEGTWMPACPLNWVKQGGFYGVEDLAHRSPIPEFNKPLCWLSKNEFDNSGGGQVWVTSDKWGPFQGELLHMSYGKCALYLVMKQEVSGQMQGGLVRIPVNFTSSAMRARFNPADGQLYVAGLRGWQSSAASITGFDRVRYTGKPVYTVAGLKVDRDGVHLTFTQPLNPADATDAQNFSVQQWNYIRSNNYGSPEVSPNDPKKRGREQIEAKAIHLSPDGKTLTLRFADLKPVDQLLVRYNITAKDGTPIKQDVLQTIHAIP